MKQQVSSHAVNRRLQITRVTIITAPIPRVAAIASERHRRLSAGWMLLSRIIRARFAASRRLVEITRARNRSRSSSKCSITFVQFIFSPGEKRDSNYIVTRGHGCLKLFQADFEPFRDETTNPRFNRHLLQRGSDFFDRSNCLR